MNSKPNAQPDATAPAPGQISDLEEAVLHAVDRIPTARVRTYGDIADELGCHPRQVGRIMAHFGAGTHWWRVVRADGTSAVAQRARAYWDKEGIPNNGRRVSAEMLQRPGRARVQPQE